MCRAQHQMASPRGNGGARRAIYSGRHGARRNRPGRIRRRDLRARAVGHHGDGVRARRAHLRRAAGRRAAGRSRTARCCATPFLTVASIRPASAGCSASRSIRTSRPTTSSTCTTRRRRPPSTTASAASPPTATSRSAGSEAVLLEPGHALRARPTTTAARIHFGTDGKLYVAVGENANGANAQTLDNLLGKMLRINSDGTIPTDNPFFARRRGEQPGDLGAAACATRSPSRSSRGTGRIFINDVGAEHVGGDQRRRRGRQLRLAARPKGRPTDPRFRGPFFAYPHAQLERLRHHRRGLLQPDHGQFPPSTSATTSSPTTAAAGSGG